MLDGMSIDQLRTFVAAVDEGSFSAAGRKLHRAQSVVSATLANLESQVGFPLFDRTGRFPKLTEAGIALLEAARHVTDGMDAFKAKARTLAEGLEPELAVSVDVMFPIENLTVAVKEFHKTFPATPLHLYVEPLGGGASTVTFRALSGGDYRFAT
ncbi:LysR family transcriptional regulator [Enterobacter cloacae]|uniref:LysR family transcriptional regulator n=1 Tax=Enterobacter cloacae TaxID=550 RepID=UPI001F0AB509|nr:LysR family transcriptional regulator [Enterobacter cloacae]MDW3563485.1 LysR family transcriptional regulator [Enterobacter cloacae]WNJ09263.1 LysR family transcriptional regulator [Enterobacter cloacae]